MIRLILVILDGVIPLGSRTHKYKRGKKGNCLH